MKNVISIVVLTALSFVTVGCIHKTSGSVTPIERVTTDNAVFAQLNNSIEKGSEALALSGILKPADVAPVIEFTGRVASIHEQITSILNKGSAVTASDYLTVQALVAQLNASAAVLVSSGALGVKNPQTQQTVAADIQSLSSLANLILSELSAYAPKN